MKKEILIAIFVGLSMGLIITFGVYRVRSSVTDKPIVDFVEQTREENQATATPTILALHNPEDGTVQTETELTVTGTTVADSFIILFVNNTDYISNSDESGNFSFKIELDDGANVIRVHVLDADGGTSVVEERLVIVSDEFEKLEEAKAQLEVEQATSSADTNSETVTGEKITNE